MSLRFRFARFALPAIVLTACSLLAACASTPAVEGESFVVHKRAAAPSGYTAYINSRTVVAQEQDEKRTAQELSPSG